MIKRFLRKKGENKKIWLKGKFWLRKIGNIISEIRELEYCLHFVFIQPLFKQFSKLLFAKKLPGHEI